MGKLAYAAKATHVPSLYLSELPDKFHGIRQNAIDGLQEIGRRMKEKSVDTVIIFDTHWLVNSAYHINCGEHFNGTYSSNELPHFIHDMEYEHTGKPELGMLIADEAKKLVKVSENSFTAQPKFKKDNVSLKLSHSCKLTFGNFH